MTKHLVTEDMKTYTEDMKTVTQDILYMGWLRSVGSIKL